MCPRADRTACSDSTAGSTGTAPTGAIDQIASLKGVNLTMWVAQNSVAEPEQAITPFEKATGAEVTTQVIPGPYESNVPTKPASGGFLLCLFPRPARR